MANLETLPRECIVRTLEYVRRDMIDDLVGAFCVAEGKDMESL